MKRLAIAALSIAFAVGCSSNSSRVDLISYVDPLIGSGAHGHVFVGANVPFGAVQLGLTNISEGWDWTSGYHISDSTIIGYAHSHLSGTGIGDKGDILFMPYVGELAGRHKSDYISSYSRENEVAEAGYYRVIDNRYGVKAEFTASTRVGFHRYTFPKDSTERLIINLHHGTGWDSHRSSLVELKGKNRIEGYRLSQGWADDDRVYFVAEFSSDIKSFEWDTTAMVAILEFEGHEPLEAAVAISGTGIEGAAKNFSAEASGVSFDSAKAAAQDSWRELLGRMEVESSDQSRLRTFYTAIFHSAFYPSIFSDVDGRYRGADGKIHSAEHDTYTNFSLWDTYRAAHPLFTIMTPERVPDMVNSMLNIYDQQGKLPVWHLAGNETNCMVGISGVQVVGDAIVKGFKGVDPERGFRAMADYANQNYAGLRSIRELGYFPADEELESVAKAMEYCISDAAVARVATMLGKSEEAELFTKRSQGYKHYFDPSDNFVKGKLSDGSFRTPFDPQHSTHRADDFCEGNAWQYTWMVPHDYAGLFELMGGAQNAEKHLDATFSTPFNPAQHASPDISGMIGQVAHGNEPSHATPFAYAAMGRPEKTSKIVRHILDSLYNDTPEGISGNEDMGAMSAWYVLNAAGIYQPDPSSGVFVFGSPLFERLVIQLPESKTLEVLCENYGAGNIYIESATIDGTPLDGSITYEQLMGGGKLIFKMKGETK